MVSFLLRSTGEGTAASAPASAPICTYLVPTVSSLASWRPRVWKAVSATGQPAIVQAAFGLLDEAGMDGLTVRVLASRLGVQAPALYWHVRSKQALLDEMATQVWRRIGEVMAGLPAGLPWREVMATYAATVRTELLGHRDGAKAFRAPR
jgi:AcrR family transcriptional regulator